MTKLCIKCGRELPLDNFRKVYKSPDGHAHHCKECAQLDRVSKTKNLVGGGNPELASFKSRELIEELRARGYKGTLEYTNKITL